MSMTRGEAIDIIENKIQIDVRFCAKEDVEAYQEALTMAISALCPASWEQAEKAGDKYEIREICGDWALDIHWGKETIMLFFNSRNNAELVKAILEWEDAHPNAAVPYKPAPTLSNEAEKAIQRLGEFGKLFLDYSGDPRGPMGALGNSDAEEWVTMMDPIQDVDGEWWRPVQEQALQKLFSKLKSLELATPNEPLTLEQLREMDGEPVWVTPLGFWALVIAKPGERVKLICNDGEIVYADKEIELVGPVYRRPPGGEEGT